MPLVAKFVGFVSEGEDICVLAPKEKLSPPCPFPSSSPGIAYGQDVFFLGFPYGMGFNLGMDIGFNPAPNKTSYRFAFSAM